MESLQDQADLDRRLESLRERSPSFPDRQRPFTSLVEAIVWCAKVPAEAVTLEASAGPRRPMGDVMREEQRLGDAELDRARGLALDFENGLRLARAAGPNELSLDSRDPAHDRIADALISTLVASDFAAVRTEELGDEQYRYHLTVDWAALDAFAARVGLPAVSELLDDRPA